jgi:putative endonuclease
MSDSKELGNQGEDAASSFLVKKGYKILVRNFKMGANEIDIIAENENFIVFVEVKTRSGKYLEHPNTAVTVSKQKAIIKTADQYIRRYNIDKESRFDIRTIIKNNDEFEIVHIENAFYPTLR